jgi:hypothetical protein
LSRPRLLAGLARPTAPVALCLCYALAAYKPFSTATRGGAVWWLVEQLKEVREFEKQNKNRETLIEQIDRKIRANNS